MQVGAIIQLKKEAFFDQRSLFMCERVPQHGKRYTVREIFFGSFEHNSHKVFVTLEEIRNPKVRVTRFNEPREVGFKASLFDCLLDNITDIENYIVQHTVLK